MQTRNFVAGAAVLAAVAMFPTTTRANLLSNVGFETPDASGGDVFDAPAAPWIGFNDPGLRYTTSTVARTGNQSLKMFGPFDFIGGGVGAVQAVPATPGTTYTGEIWALNNSADAIQGNNFGVFKLEFLDAGFNLIPGGLGVGFVESNPINAGTPQDQWTLLGAGGVAAAGTAWVQAVIVQVQLGDGNGAFVGGSIFWDDASVTAVPEPTTLALLGMGGIVVLRRRR
ncbi:MAG: PEP-CTERM sorting domain-containing protein [Phycisphaerales bacterium]|nr:PEP-CTERM sorting domain-containing protein [Phycisphaerales bacterium]